MATPFQQIALFARQREDNTGTIQTLSVLRDSLLKHGFKVCLEVDTANMLSDQHSEQAPFDCLTEQADCLIVVGGDGSLLHAARAAEQFDLPLLGINRGRLGFLADVMPQELETALLPILRGEYIEEKRFLLRCELSQNGKVVYSANALNDTVLLPSIAAHMIEFSVFVDDQLVCQQRADGMIVATPTGSTAYALSAGGPILHPELNTIVLVPMFPHRLTSRPIVISSSHTITLSLSEHNNKPAQISCDGQAAQTVSKGDIIQIRKNDRSLRLIHPVGYDYYHTLRSKLGWEAKNKSSGQ